MDGAVWGFIGVVVGGLITGLVTIRAESIRADKAAKLDRDKREDDRRIAADSFQRETLLALQERLAEFMRAEGKGHHADVMALRAGGLTQYPEGVSDEMFLSNRGLGFAVQRVKDDELRAAIAALTRRVAEVQAGRAVYHEDVTEAQLDAELLELMRFGDAADERLGVVLRTLI